MASKPVYIGFNTVGQNRPPYSLTDIELVKRDLTNEFNTRIGERIMLPFYGSRIQELLMDPFDDITRREIIDDVIRVIGNDPRVSFVDTKVTSTDYTIKVEVVLTYSPGDTAETLFLEFQRSDKETN